MKYQINTFSENGHCCFSDSQIKFTADSSVKEAFFSLCLLPEQWEDDAYILLPACAYNGNRQPRVQREYPPMFEPEEEGLHCAPLMTDVPALNPDGSGSIQVTTGDLATPCVGIFYRRAKTALLLFTEQQIKGVNLGYTVKAGEILISYPARRTDLYRSCKAHLTEGDHGIAVEQGEVLSSQLRILSFDCEDIPAFFRRFFAERKCLLHDARAKNLYTKELWDLMEQHFNEVNWSGKYYAEASHKWQSGWVGGGMSSYPLLKCGNALSRQRAEQTLDFMTAHQSKSGFFYGMIEPDGFITDDCFYHPRTHGYHMVRKSADALYFLFKHFSIEGIKQKQAWINSAKAVADAFVKLFETYGTFGQFVDIETGEMRIGCSASGAMVPGALCKAYEYFGEKKYLEIAEKGLDFLIKEFLYQGVTNGGPGEILSAPDSESAFSLLESCMVLYEATKSPKYLAYAEDAACFCSSWVVSYRYQFPKGSEFELLHINTVGAVFANVQNKHAAPGICTLSGDSLYKLWKYTGKQEYLDLILDISRCIPQCVSREERLIHSWDIPPRTLPAGYICERINMSDWEDFRCVGGVAYGTCWCETSLILSFIELMNYPEMQ